MQKKLVSYISLFLVITTIGCQSEEPTITELPATQTQTSTPIPPTYTETIPPADQFKTREANRATESVFKTGTASAIGTATQLYITPTITDTATSTPTPTNTATSTITPTPVNLAYCSLIQNANSFEENLESNVGKCYRFMWDPDRGALEPGFVNAVSSRLKIDPLTPEDLEKPHEYSQVWGVLTLEDGYPYFAIREVKEFDETKQPRFCSKRYDDCLWEVGVLMAPGSWKSSLSSTASDSCYWARVNKNSGSIISNHFGIGGVSVYLYEGEIFETTRDCGTWYYQSQ
jgi:hypothetical protein